MSHKVSVIFVCLGNICRSPTAHAVFRDLVLAEDLQDQIRIDSAGTASWHKGKPADSRSIEVAHGRGIQMDDLRSRPVDMGDLIEFDYVLAMDDANYADLMAMALPEQREKIRMFLEFAPEFEEREVPDPYYGGPQGFDHVFDLVTAASQGLLTEIKRSHL
ncbi:MULTISPECIES: low molecular weight protein-tyrosine-phosphatase [Piscirickettsiaceae]|jgi:protein-tyrosine phosphatase|uniref:Low molecular weight phosphotyrosine protein phosphatase n=1 Tax=Hydrogenovibrio thermophilus TaxID=265883 RepID=A0A410H1U3_9GAMM|nr:MULTISPECIES: low molecular weight protein-tyrosine-phosphatase [Piscirickettsiaceae]AZR82551.1 phosphotyrosine protein phosphatase [Thiomicrospira sp. S5]QAB14886.1 low molecular weight phosphotyrosine protein phosphatase [Hydrogenovibrio thermophilus]